MFQYFIIFVLLFGGVQVADHQPQKKAPAAVKPVQHTPVATVPVKSSTPAQSKAPAAQQPKAPSGFVPAASRPVVTFPNVPASTVTGAVLSPTPRPIATAPVKAAPAPAAKADPTPAPTATSNAAFEQQVVALVNKERAAQGLGALKVSGQLAGMAHDKAVDMFDKNYFDHNSPTYGSPFDMMKRYNIDYSYAGENIAKGQRTPAEVMAAWMKSPGHKQNILSPNYDEIGVAYYRGEWVQEFIKAK